MTSVAKLLGLSVNLAAHGAWSQPPLRGLMALWGDRVNVESPIVSRRFQFSLASLLIATVVVAGAVNWWTLHQRLVAARHEFERESAFHEIGTAALPDVTRASKELLQAELAMPFVPSDKIAWLSYLDRTRHLHRKEQAMANTALFSSFDAMVQTQRFADELLDECHSVEDRLGLPHVDNDYFRSEDGHYAYENDHGEQPGEPDTNEVSPPPPDD